MLLDLLLVSLVRPSLCFAYAQAQVVQDAAAQQVALPAEIEALIQRLAGTRPWKHSPEFLQFEPAFEELPLGTALSLALEESELRTQVVGDLLEGERRLVMLRALLGTEEQHERIALRVAMARAKLLGETRGAQEARAALMNPYPPLEEAIEVARWSGMLVDPLAGPAIDEARLRAAFIEVLDEWTQLASWLEPESARKAAPGAGNAGDEAWLSELLDLDSKQLLEERFGLPSAAIAERVGRELYDGGAEHLQKLGSVAVPALAFYAVAGERGMGAFLVEPVLRLNPMLELARLEPSAAYELIAALAPRRDAEWRQGAVGSYLRASEGVPLASTSLWLQHAAESWSLESRAPERMAALATLLRDGRTHGALRGELETLIGLDALVGGTAEALAECLSQQGPEAALELLAVVDPNGRSLRSNGAILEAGARHADAQVRKVAELSLARGGWWRALMEIEEEERRQQLLLEAFSGDLGGTQLGRILGSTELLEADWDRRTSFNRAPHVEFLADDQSKLVQIFESGSIEMRLAMLGVVSCEVPGDFEELVQTALRDTDERVQQLAAARFSFAEPDSTDLAALLPAAGEVRGLLQERWIQGFYQSEPWNERELLKLSAPLSPAAQNGLFRLLNGNWRLGPEAGVHVGSVLLASQPLGDSESYWRRLYEENLRALDMDARLLAMAQTQGFSNLERDLVIDATALGRLPELLRSSYSAGAEVWMGTELGRRDSAAVEPGWWARSEDTARRLRDVSVAQQGERASFVSEEILSGRLQRYEALRWTWALEPYDLPAARAAIVHLLEDSELDLGQLASLRVAPANNRSLLWFGSQLPRSANGAELLRSILSSERIPLEVRASATAWLDPQLTDSFELAQLAYDVLMDPARTLPPVSPQLNASSLDVAASILLRGGEGQRIVADVRTRSYSALIYRTLADLAEADPAVDTADGLAYRLLRDPRCPGAYQQQAARAIAMSGSEAARDLLLDVLPGVTEPARIEIRERLSDLDRRDELGTESPADEAAQVRQQLLDWIASDRPGHQQAILSLGSVGTVSDLLLLIELTQHEDSTIRTVAKTSLDALNARLSQ